MRLSIVLPVLDAAKTLQATLASLGTDDDIVLADGGSRDASAIDASASAPGVRLVVAPRGRGSQLRAGADAAAGDWLLFVHADTRLSAGWRRAVADFAANPANADKAGYFELAFDGQDRRAARIARLANWRARVFGLPYGDQGLMIGRAFYQKLGGYKPIPLMEDVDLVRRIGKRNLVRLAVTATTSAVRYERDGYAARPLKNLACLALYFLGVSPQTILRLYR
jgi:rSAM/selenodomain-associated transferase 2